MLKASLSSFFTDMDDKLAVAADRVQLCEMCIAVTKYAILIANKSPLPHDFEATVATHACKRYSSNEHRAEDCLTLTHGILDHQLSDFTGHEGRFTNAELALSVEELRTLIVSKSDQKCAEMSCCGSKIFRRHLYPQSNGGALQPEDIDAEARLLSSQEMELVNQRSQILQQKLALDEHISELRRDASLLEQTKASVRERRRALDELERRLRHREERLTEKEQDLAEKQKLTPYYIPYPINFAGNAPPLAPAASSPAPPAPASNPPPTTIPASSPPASSSLETTLSSPSSPSSLPSSPSVSDRLAEDDENFISLLERMHDSDLD